MRKLVVLAVMAASVCVARAKVWTTVYRCDGRTPLEAIDPNHPTIYRDIMVGTRLVLVVGSDQGEYWAGGLQLSQVDALYGTLSGRGYVKSPRNYRDSCLPAAGETARALPYVRSWPAGLNFFTSPYLPVLPGDWFVVDYHAEQVGTCNVALYDYGTDEDTLIQVLSFTHVPSRDFNGDTVVDFKDLALLALHWSPKADPNGRDAPFDLHTDGRIDFGDLALFSEDWLKRTDCANASQ